MEFLNSTASTSGNMNRIRGSVRYVGDIYDKFEKKRMDWYHGKGKEVEETEEELLTKLYEQTKVLKNHIESFEEDLFYARQGWGNEDREYVIWALRNDRSQFDSLKGIVEYAAGDYWSIKYLDPEKVKVILMDMVITEEIMVGEGGLIIDSTYKHLDIDF